MSSANLERAEIKGNSHCDRGSAMQIVRPHCNYCGQRLSSFDSAKPEKGDLPSHFSVSCRTRCLWKTHEVGGNNSFLICSWMLWRISSLVGSLLWGSCGCNNRAPVAVTAADGGWLPWVWALGLGPFHPFGFGFYLVFLFFFEVFVGPDMRLERSIRNVSPVEEEFVNERFELGQAQVGAGGLKGVSRRLAVTWRFAGRRVGA
jgi:hypothetical protein